MSELTRSFLVYVWIIISYMKNCLITFYFLDESQRSEYVGKWTELPQKRIQDPKAKLLNNNMISKSQEINKIWEKWEKNGKNMILDSIL